MSMLHLLSALMPKGAAPTLTLTFINSAVSSGASITIPAAALENDIAFLADFSRDGSDNILPSGFTSLANTLAEGDARLRASYRVLGSSPGGTSVTGMNGATSNAKVMLVFRPSLTVTVAVPTWSGAGGTGDPANQTVTASGQTPPLVVIGVAGTTGTPSFNVQTPAFSATVTQGGIIVGYIVYNDTPLNHTVGMADLGSRNVLQSGYIRAVS